MNGDVLSQVLTPDFLKGLGAVSILFIVLLSLTLDKGPLRLTREFRPVLDENAFLRAANSKQADQITTLTNELRTMNSFMAGVKSVAEDKAAS